MAARKKATVRAAAIPAKRGHEFEFRRLIPTGRSIVVGLVLLALAGAAYAAALETSVFAVRKMVIVGGSAKTQAAVKAALTPELGRSLLRINNEDVQQRLSSVTTVRSVTVDREFPNTIKVRIKPELPVLLLRQGDAGWVVSTHGRVLNQVKNVHLSSLPRTYVPHNVPIALGATLTPEDGGLAAQALAPLVGTRLFGRVRFVSVGGKELTLKLRSGVQVRLGDPGDLRLKFAITRKILAVLGPDATQGYVDVSVPQRPVLGQ
ncbi:MAG TPA: FtsQ-type POTRA domain-containing protein [Gaiellaceae bacterium]|nr:FtsQ-type POTRA domain-containing protein [Gaiellaceae bacterium]